MFTMTIRNRIRNYQSLFCSFVVTTPIETSNKENYINFSFVLLRRLSRKTLSIRTGEFDIRSYMEVFSISIFKNYFLRCDKENVELFLSILLQFHWLPMVN